MTRDCHLANSPSTAIPQHASHGEDGEDVPGTIYSCTRQEIPEYFLEWTKFWDEDDEDANKSKIGEGAERPVHNPPSESRPSVPSTHCEATNRIPSTATVGQVILPIGGHANTSMPPLAREPTCSPQVLQTPVEPVYSLVNMDQRSAADRLEPNYSKTTYAVHSPTGLNLCTMASDGQSTLGSAGIMRPPSLKALDSCSKSVHIDDTTEVVQGNCITGTGQAASEAFPSRSDSCSPYSPIINAPRVNSQEHTAQSLTLLDMQYEGPDVRRLHKSPEGLKRARGAEDAMNPYNRKSQNSDDAQGQAEGLVTDIDAEKEKEVASTLSLRCEWQGFVRKLVQANGTSAKPLRVTIMEKIGLERNISKSEQIKCPFPGCGDVVIAEDLFSQFGSHFKKLDLQEAATAQTCLLCITCNGRVSRDSWESIERHMLNNAHAEDRQELGLKGEWVPSLRIAAGRTAKMDAEGVDSKNDGDNEGSRKGIKRRRLR
ncbi:uncharacterized protein FOMMEDRAFT_149687 [Fomitiporia mediterranea MF3/22]|uniref:uncharacterized protein n=1 Tax=Fomitiporia mediterranea (strain MF3/22) TaxID=694068 RepID=UPI00044097C6|nr:uncharacterized protein FOMMEDRAFT_149687 [Fomitiporia mediterranea MF3/22]EJD07188.1 hypothetical protein FOMMEDRAFT_149687 [Fomitiporia mediterranea MF3/22]